jgi:hypothetical protein
MWFTMKGGICRYDGKTFTEFTTKDGLGGYEVNGIYAEKSGIIWITARGSTTRYDPSIAILLLSHLLYLQWKTELTVVFKVCIKIGLEICGGVLDKDFIDLMENAFIRLKRKGRGSINNGTGQNRIKKQTCGE